MVNERRTGAGVRENLRVDDVFPRQHFAAVGQMPIEVVVEQWISNDDTGKQ